MSALHEVVGVHRAANFKQMTVSGAEGVQWFSDVMAQGNKRVDVELFALSESGAIGALKRQAKSGVKVKVLADPENSATAMAAHELQGAGVKYTNYGQSARDARKGVAWSDERNPAKVHAKVGSVDNGGSAWVSTLSLYRKGPESVDVTGIAHGDTARAVSSLTRAAETGKRSKIRKSAQVAARSGIVLNDATAGVSLLTKAYTAAIRSAKSELVVSFKIMTDEKLASDIVDAHRRGVTVHMKTHLGKMSGKVGKLFSEEGIAVQGDPYGVLHANTVVADGKVAVYGSAHASPRALGRTGTHRKSREIGAVVNKPHHVELIRSIAYPGRLPQTG